MKNRAALLLSTGAFALVGCRTIEGTHGVPPFYEVYDTPSSVGSERGEEVFFRPLGSYERLEPLEPPGRGSTDWTPRPTPPRIIPREPTTGASRPALPSSAVQAPAGLEPSLAPGPASRPATQSPTQSASHHLRFLSPFFDFRWGPEERRYTVLALYRYQSLPQPYSGEDVDWMLFPFLYGGSDPDEGSYFAFFPLGGKLRGLFAQDEIHFALFPLYWHARDRERHSLHVAWPFHNTVWGRNQFGGKESGWRLWPFYGRYQSLTADGKLRHDRGFIFWPFYIRGKDEMNVNPTEVFFTLPFYGERTNRRTETHAYLWPFFQTHYDRKYDRKTYMGFLIPYRLTDGQVDLWPLFGVKRWSRGLELGGTVRRNYRHYFLWPIERYDWATDGIQETTRFWLLPLLWHFHYIDTNTLETESEWTAWPIFRYRRVGRSVSFDLISPLWFRREDYDRLYSRWFNVFRYRWKPEISGWELAYGFLMYRREDETQEAVFSVLGGLFECGTREGGFAVRLLYLPWR